MPLGICRAVGGLRCSR